MDNQKRTITAVAAIALLVIGIAAGYLIGNRSDQQSSSSPTVAGVSARGSATAHNDADVMFVQMMIPHHEQALAMAKMADSRASAVPVKALASAIQTAQQPEIDKMKGWLQTWGASPSTSMSMGGGMMSDTDMKELMNLQGAAFDKQFLTTMSQHHDGAISMANSEQWSTLKTEYYDRHHWTTRADAKQAVGTWIEDRYNRRRRHSALDMLSPVASENAMPQTAQAALPRVHQRG